MGMLRFFLITLCLEENFKRVLSLKQVFYIVTSSMPRVASLRVLQFTQFSVQLLIVPLLSLLECPGFGNKLYVTSLLAQVVDNLPAMQETWVQSLGQEDPLEGKIATHSSILDFPGGSDGKASAYNVGDPSSIPGSGRSPGEGMAIHSSILAWKIPWTEEPGKLQSTGSQRVGHD